MSHPAMDPPQGAESDPEHPKDIIWSINIVTQSLTLAICSFFVLARVLQKFRLPSWFLSVDDYLTLVSWFLMVGYCICGILLSVHGGGYHIWEVTSSEVTQFLKTGYAATIFYAPMTLTIKLSLLSLIARVFAPFKRKVQGIYGLGVVLIIYYITSWLLKIRICSPISAYWRLEVDKCLDQSAIILGDSIMSTLTDAIILLLPLPLTWSLQIPRNRKLRVGGMLAVGGLATAFSAWRLHLIVVDGASPDATILFVRIVLTGNAEAGLALICTCLPAFVGQFRQLESRIRYGSSRSRNVEINEITSDGDNLKSPRACVRDTPTARYQSYAVQSPDEVELVTHAQGAPTQECDVEQHNGILRQVEVTHKISYTTEHSDTQSKVESL